MIFNVLLYLLALMTYAVLRMLPDPAFQPWPDWITDGVSNFGDLVNGVAVILPPGALVVMGVSMLFLLTWKLWLLPFVLGQKLINIKSGSARMYDDPDLLGAYEESQRADYARDNAVFVGSDLQDEFN